MITYPGQRRRHRPRANRARPHLKLRIIGELMATPSPGDPANPPPHARSSLPTLVPHRRLADPRRRPLPAAQTHPRRAALRLDRHHVRRRHRPAGQDLLAQHRRPARHPRLRRPARLRPPLPARQLLRLGPALASRSRSATTAPSSSSSPACSTSSPPSTRTRWPTEGRPPDADPLQRRAALLLLHRPSSSASRSAPSPSDDPLRRLLLRALRRRHHRRQLAHVLHQAAKFIVIRCFCNKQKPRIRVIRMRGFAFLQLAT